MRGGVREYNYDLLRIVCTIAVITIHVSGIYYNCLTQTEFFGQLYTQNAFLTCIYNGISRFAVPCFVMLSGAFLLANPKNQDFKYFYRKSFNYLGVQTIIYTIFYFVFFFVCKSLAIAYKGKAPIEILEPFIDLLKGRPYYHMWYLYMLIGVYIAVPAIIIIKDKLSEATFSKVAWTFMFLATISSLTHSALLCYDIGFSFCYIGFLLLGYEIRKRVTTKDNIKAFMYIGASIILCGLVGIIQYYTLDLEIPDQLKPEGNFSPLVVLGTIFLFTGFAYLKVSLNLSKLSSLSFVIYLIHAFILYVISQVLRKYGYNLNNAYVIPVLILVVFILSAIYAEIYIRIYNWILSKLKSS